MPKRKICYQNNTRIVNVNNMLSICSFFFLKVCSLPSIDINHCICALLVKRLLNCTSQKEIKIKKTIVKIIPVFH